MRPSGKSLLYRTVAARAEPAMNTSDNRANGRAAMRFMSDLLNHDDFLPVHSRAARLSPARRTNSSLLPCPCRSGSSDSPGSVISLLWPPDKTIFESIREGFRRRIPVPCLPRARGSRGVHTSGALSVRAPAHGNLRFRPLTPEKEWHETPPCGMPNKIVARLTKKSGRPHSCPVQDGGSCPHHPDSCPPDA